MKKLIRFLKEDIFSTILWLLTLWYFPIIFVVFWGIFLVLAYGSLFHESLDEDKQHLMETILKTLWCVFLFSMFILLAWSIRDVGGGGYEPNPNSGYHR